VGDECARGDRFRLLALLSSHPRPIRKAGTIGVRFRGSSVVGNAAIFVVLASGNVTYAVMQSLLLPVLPTIERELGVGQGASAWISTAYLLSASVFTPLLGRLGDSLGRRPLLIFCLTMTAIGSVVAGLADDIWVMILARVVQGAAGGVIPLTFGIARETYSQPRGTAVVGTLSALLAAGVAVGTVVAGPTVAFLGYRWLYWIPALASVLVAAFARILLPRSVRGQRFRPPVRSLVLLPLWLVPMLLATSLGPSRGWGSWLVLALAGVTAIAAPLWYRAETRAATPLVDLSVMRVRGVWSANLVVLLVGAGLYGAAVLGPQLVQTNPAQGFGFGASATDAGLLILPAAVAEFAAGMSTAWLVVRIGSRGVVVGGAGVVAVSLCGLAFWHHTPAQFVISFAMLGAGIGLTLAAIANVVIDAVRTDQTSAAAAVNANIRSIGGAFGTALVAGIFSATATANGTSGETGYVSGFVMLAILAALGAVAGTAIPSVRHPTGRGGDQAPGPVS
jgi:MFS family permease